MSKHDANRQAKISAISTDATQRANSSPTSDAIRQWLDQQTEQFDAPTLQQLSRGRRAAVAEAGQTARHQRWQWVVSATAAASLCLAVMLALQPTLWSTNSVPPAPASMEAFMMLASPESEEVLDSMDFYIWLESQEIDGDDGAG